MLEQTKWNLGQIYNWFHKVSSVFLILHSLCASWSGQSNLGSLDLIRSETDALHTLSWMSGSVIHVTAASERLLCWTPTALQWWSIAVAWCRFLPSASLVLFNLSSVTLNNIGVLVEEFKTFLTGWILPAFCFSYLPVLTPLQFIFSCLFKLHNSISLFIHSVLIQIHW